MANTYDLSFHDMQKADKEVAINSYKADSIINKHEEIALLDDIPLPIKAIGAAMALPAAVKEGLKILQRKFQKRKLLDNTYNKRQLQSMADPLPHPSKDTRKKPNPNSKPSSPSEDWRDYTGKGPAQASLDDDWKILLPYKGVPQDDREWGEGDVPGHPDWKLAHQTHTDNPQWSGEHDPKDHILYDESGEPVLMETPDGLVPYKEQLMSHNYRSGPPTDGIKDIIIERANELMKIGEQDKALELMKIVPGLLQQV